MCVIQIHETLAGDINLRLKNRKKDVKIRGDIWKASEIWKEATVQGDKGTFKKLFQKRNFSKMNLIKAEFFK